MVTHNTNVRMAMPNTTGTKIPVIRSTMRCTGALLPCASCTIAIIRASTVSLPTCAARMINEPRWLIVPANTLSPFFFSTGTGSPLIILSSTTSRLRKADRPQVFALPDVQPPNHLPGVFQSRSPPPLHCAEHEPL